MKNTIKFLAAVALLSVGFANAQVGVGTTTPDASAVLDVSSTTKGLLLPRMTTSQRNAITLPATGLSIFNTDTKQVQANLGTDIAPIWGQNTGGGVQEFTGAGVISDTTNFVLYNSAATNVLTTPSPVAGKSFWVRSTGLGAATVAGQNINGGRMRCFVSDGTTWYPSNQ